MYVTNDRDLGRCVVPEAADALQEGALTTAEQARALARRLLEAAETIDPQHEDLEFGVCLGGVQVGDDSDEGVYADPLDAVERAVQEFRKLEADELEEPVQILVWPS